MYTLSSVADRNSPARFLKHGLPAYGNLVSFGVQTRLDCGQPLCFWHISCGDRILIWETFWRCIKISLPCFHSRTCYSGRKKVPGRVLGKGSGEGFWGRVLGKGSGEGFWGRVLRRVLGSGPSAMDFTVRKGSEKGSQKGVLRRGFLEGAQNAALKSMPP